MSKFIVGADISKDKINYALYFNGNVLLEREIENNIKAITKFLSEIKAFIKHYNKQHQLDGTLIFVMEYTGIYNNILVSCLQNKNITMYIVPGIVIKHSSGIIRGKSDKIDAQRIADYAFRHFDKMHEFKPNSATISTLKSLSSQREKLIKVRTQLTQSKVDNKKFMDDKTYKLIDASMVKVVEQLDVSIKDLDNQMLELVRKDDDVNENFKNAVSVPGIGKTTAIALICVTDNFVKFSSAKSLGTYCGVVPHSKGSGILKGKDRVSPMCNKRMKTLLHMCALSSISRDNIFATYFEQKVTKDKKNKMLALNNVRNKILKTVYACVKNKMPYQKDFIYNNAA